MRNFTFKIHIKLTRKNERSAKDVENRWRRAISTAICVSRLCRIQLACDAQIPACLNGPEGEVVYIDTEVRVNTNTLINMICMSSSCLMRCSRQFSPLIAYICIDSSEWGQNRIHCLS